VKSEVGELAYHTHAKYEWYPCHQHPTAWRILGTGIEPTMIEVDYRQSYFVKSNDDDSDDDEGAHRKAASQRQGAQEYLNQSEAKEARKRAKEKAKNMFGDKPKDESQKDNKRGDKRGVFCSRSTDHILPDGLQSEAPKRRGMERKGSFRLERSGSFRLERKGSFRLEPFGALSRSLRLSNRNLMKDDDSDDDQSISESSISSFVSAANESTSSNFNLSIASFSASLANFSNSASQLSSMEPDSAVLKLLAQLKDRIDSRRVRRQEYEKRIDSCLELAMARYEGGSNNSAIVSMRRVHKIRMAVDQLKEVENSLLGLHGQIELELQHAQLLADGDGPVLVDIDLEHFRSSARKVEQEVNARSIEDKSDADLLEELKILVPEGPRKPPGRKVKSPARRSKRRSSQGSKKSASWRTLIKV